MAYDVLLMPLRLRNVRRIVSLGLRYIRNSAIFDRLIQAHIHTTPINYDGIARRMQATGWRPMY